MAPPSQTLISRQPHQKLSSLSRGLSAGLHTLGIISFTLSYKYLIDFPTVISDSYGWHFQYLTIIGLTIAYVTFISGLLADITLSPALFLIKNTLSLCSTPLEVLISVLYWGISAIDKSLLVPPEIHISHWADIGFHAMPSVLLVIDLLWFSPPWIIGTLPAMGLSTVLAVSYWAWVERCFKFNGFYPYPLFGHLDTIQRAALFLGGASLMTASTAGLQWLYGRVNGMAEKEKWSVSGNVKTE